MYDKIVLAYDGSREGRTALREGALLARPCHAKVFLLSVVAETEGVQIGEAAFAGAIAYEQTSYRSVLDEGLEKLHHMGFEATGRLVQGDPARTIAAFAQEVSADLVVVGHKRRNAVQRWWSGSTSGDLLDHLGCSLLVARKEFSDADFQVALTRA